ncbi:hypothetical protein EVAR_33608_1 [Eumeta japonica]|uniref:Uncharacterized protein n=1 Tax=Eumeta variegata TaxID=151549 RepID=A0A4C1WA34_EUMVA|nr:hypothetical protein EVAR_33608_1 [Eumeta japonica]
MEWLPLQMKNEHYSPAENFVDPRRVAAELKLELWCCGTSGLARGGRRGQPALDATHSGMTPEFIRPQILIYKKCTTVTPRLATPLGGTLGRSISLTGACIAARIVLLRTVEQPQQWCRRPTQAHLNWWRRSKLSRCYRKSSRLWKRSVALLDGDTSTSRRNWRQSKNALEAKTAPRALNYTEVAARSKPLAAAVPKTPGPEIRFGRGHILIVSSKYEKHTAEQVVAKLREVVDVREIGVAVDRLRKARNQKVVVSCSSAEDAKKIEEWLEMRRVDLKVSKTERKLLIVVIRDVLKVNTDEDIVRSLRTQNRYIADGIDWEKYRANVCYRKRVRYDLECHPVQEATVELYKRLTKAGYIYMVLQQRPVWD